MLPTPLSCAPFGITLALLGDQAHFTTHGLQFRVSPPNIAVRFLVLCGLQCYCSRSSDNLNSLNVATNCDMPCTGNATEMCGGHDAISVYHQSSSLVPTTNPVTVAAEDMVNEAAYHRGVGFGVASVSCSIAMLAMGGIINPNIYTSNIFGGASI